MWTTMQLYLSMPSGFSKKTKTIIRVSNRLHAIRVFLYKLENI